MNQQESREDNQTEPLPELPEAEEIKAGISRRDVNDMYIFRSPE